MGTDACRSESLSDKSISLFYLSLHAFLAFTFAMGVQHLKPAPNAPTIAPFLHDHFLQSSASKMALIVRNRRGRIHANDEVDETKSKSLRILNW